MKLSRLRAGERLALAGAVALAVLLFADWFFLSTPDARLGAHETGIRGLGWFAAFLCIAAILATFAHAFTTVTHDAPAWPIVLGVFTAVLSVLALVAIIVRLIFQPTLGVDAGGADVDLEPVAYLALLASLVQAAGGLRIMGDERTDAPESHAQTEDVLRNAMRKPPPRESAAARPSRPDALAD
ncbi:MAG TPA: hypothetical protein VN238_04830 [Solirubrobacteraceae bacterium]|nr:hypothetical protein [Solirubrobacteraceae bacterium]